MSTRQGVAPSSAEIPLPDLPPPFSWHEGEGIAWVEAPLPGGSAAFSTRIGGLSTGPYASLNLGILTDDDPERVAGNRRLLAGALGRDPDGVAMGMQVHGGDVERHTGPPSPSGYSARGELTRADGQATDHPAVTPLVLAADCVPLALSCGGAVGVAHCGWRGLTAGVVQRAVEAVTALAKAEPSQLGAAIGPAIGPCCYRVGDDVRVAVAARGLGSDVFEGEALDLPQAVGAELERAGVRPDAIAATGLCTSCRPDLFFSPRRDGGTTGRQAGVAWRAA